MTVDIFFPFFSKHKIFVCFYSEVGTRKYLADNLEIRIFFVPFHRFFVCSRITQTAGDLSNQRHNPGFVFPIQRAAAEVSIALDGGVFPITLLGAS